MLEISVISWQFCSVLHRPRLPLISAKTREWIPGYYYNFWQVKHRIFLPWHICRRISMKTGTHTKSEMAGQNGWEFKSAWFVSEAWEELCKDRDHGRSFCYGHPLRGSIRQTLYSQTTTEQVLGQWYSIYYKHHTSTCFRFLREYFSIMIFGLTISRLTDPARVQIRSPKLMTYVTVWCWSYKS